MRHEEFIMNYNKLFLDGQKLQAVLFVKRVFSGRSKPGEIEDDKGKYLGLKDCKDLIDISNSGSEFLYSLRSKFPKHYKMLNLIKIPKEYAR